MVPSRSVRLGLAATLTALLTVAFAITAQASGTPGWRVVYRNGLVGDFSSYVAVAATGSGQAWAVGGHGVAGYGFPSAAYWHHGKWVASRLPSRLLSTLVAVSADSAKDAWAVSSLDVLHWHAGKWTVARQWRLPDGPPGPQVTWVTAFSPANVWVFGGTSVGRGTWHLHGREWTKVKGLGHNVTRVSALSPSDMWAIGGSRIASVLHYLNGRWRLLTNPALDGLQFGSIYASSPTSVWVTASLIGKTSGFELLHLHGTQWTAYPIPWSTPIGVVAPFGLPQGGMSPDGHGGFWLSARDSTGTSWLMHFSSGQWSRIRLGKEAISGLTRIPGTTSLWAAGEVPVKAYTKAAIWALGKVR